MKRFRIITLGCRVNQCESDSIAARLKQDGWRQQETRGLAELVIVNTCAVTGKAAMQSRQSIRQVRRLNPDARIIITGCYAEVEPETIHNATGERDIIGHDDKFRIPELIAEPAEGGSLGYAHHRASSPAAVFAPTHLIPGSSRTRPVLKIQDGCNAFCSYCIVPRARGQSRSMPVDDVIENIRLFDDAGYREVVLSGIHLGCYGLDLEPSTTLQHLLERIEHATDIDRIRLSSIEPKELTDRIIDLVARVDRFCSHFHIPLQSGDNGILRRMRRPYTAEVFAGLTRKIRNRDPDAAIGADVLIEFPGETDEAFENTFQLVDKLPITYLHVFPFSPRAGTPAAKMPDPVPPHVQKERARRIRQLGATKRTHFYHSAIEKRLEVLIEEKRDPETGWLKGISSNYITTLIDGPDALKNRLVHVKGISLSDDDRLLGRMLQTVRPNMA
ncbi:tRNA t(6)A37-methylthiotransferase (EC [Olavius algarvensis associated proteobacterium Delta 3]|nr:tRNA t(6)A37-methylthiotransferase (EC [Olavius algarvensis associated proteobacterium Delta 3]